MAKQKVIVVGNGMVGHRFIEYLLEHEKAAEFVITTFSEEPRLAYDRVHLSDAVSETSSIYVFQAMSGG